ncbi:MAG: transcriptional repressor NrdR [Planctomycetes bacterium]|nr:transcriptional repressor NrdR [Planctomycetota bacterium]
MKCPFCRADNDRVIDSRAHQDGIAIRRRRLCQSCRRRYTTYERVEESTIKVIKKDDVRVPFDREKIKRGIERACWKRPVREEQLDEIVTKIENQICDSMESEIESRQLGEMVMEHLRVVDQIAYVRFASVYRDFTDAQDFVEELNEMLEEKPCAPR